MRASAVLMMALAAPAALAQPITGPAKPAPSALERLRAAEQDSQNLQRAVNLARNTAVELNGGLGVYQPGLCMVESKRVRDCLISRGANGFVFRFPGGEPGWIAEQKPASFETEISIAADGRSVLRTLYNGPIRTAPDRAGTVAPCDCVCPPAAATPRS